ITAAFWAWAKYKKIKLPPWFYIYAAGIVLGLVLLFGASGLSVRAGHWYFTAFYQKNIWGKLFLFLNRANDLLAATYLIPLLTPALALFLAREKWGQIKADNSFYLSVLFWAAACALAGALALAPTDLILRPFYSATVFFIISFLLLVQAAQRAYGKNLFKYLFLGFFIYFAAILPFYVIPYIDLYARDKARLKTLKAAPEGAAVLVSHHKVIAGPGKNLTIDYFDYLGLRGYKTHNNIKAVAMLEPDTPIQEAVLKY
ncbi:MAG: DUF6056 family protein, partial [Elusimicrobiota bacterium]|nr:DUF6056 family protein [Elusimicrobiota bacterium]